MYIFIQFYTHRRYDPSRDPHMFATKLYESAIFWIENNWITFGGVVFFWNFPLKSLQIAQTKSKVHNWLVVWNINLVGNNHPNWRTHIFQRGRSSTHQIRLWDKPMVNRPFSTGLQNGVETVETCIASRFPPGWIQRKRGLGGGWNSTALVWWGTPSSFCPMDPWCLAGSQRSQQEVP